jgi:NitT/TauT family transport system substrate-binding protein
VRRKLGRDAPAAALTRRQLLRGCSGVGVALLTACSSAGAPPAQTPVPTQAPAPTAAPTAASAGNLKFAFAGGLGSAGLYIALDRGYLKDENLTFEEVRFDTSAGMIPSLSTGQVDFGIGGVAAGLFNSIAQGISVRLVLDSWTALPGNQAGGLIVRQDLIDSGRVHDLPDVKGLRVAVTSKGQATEYALNIALASVGLTAADVDVTELSYPNMTAALASRNIDAAISIEPFAAQAVRQGVAARFKAWPEIIPNDNPAMVIFSQALAEGRNDQARRFAKAYVHGVRDYEAARTSGRERAEVIASMVRHLDLKDPAIYEQMPWPSIDPNGRINLEALTHSQAWFVDHGYVQKAIDLSQVVDYQFADYAVGQLGRQPAN